MILGNPITLGMQGSAGGLLWPGIIADEVEEINRGHVLEECSGHGKAYGVFPNKMVN